MISHTLLDSVRAKAQFTLLENLVEGEDADVKILLHYSNETLQYCFSEFLKENQTDTRADVMASICKKIISDWGEPLLMIDSDPTMAAQERFDFYLEQALKHFEELEQDELIEKYPANCVLLKLTGHMNIQPNWGITLRAENATPNGATIILTQEGGYRANGLVYGRDYNLQKYENNQWMNVEPIIELIWFTDARTVPLDSSISWNIDWSQTFGTLEPGLYRFCKSISDHRAPGNNDHATFYAEFVIE